MVLYDDLRYVNPKYLRSAQLLGRSYPQLVLAPIGDGCCAPARCC
jgi:hypothetical protein